MPKLTLIDCQNSGVSGDMLLAALVDAGASLKHIRDVLDRIPRTYPRCKEVQLDLNEVKTHGFRALQVNFQILEDKREASAEEIVRAARGITEAASMSEPAASLVRNTFSMLMKAEGRVHGVKENEVHLHELGSTDTLADILGVAAACEDLGIFDGRVYCTPVSLGAGSVTFSHGVTSTPAPTVLEILRENRIPLTGGPENVELTTPTGIALLANLTREFTQTYPNMIPGKVGYGAGSKTLASRPNVLRVVLGESIESSHSERDVVALLETNLDDLSGEILGGTLQRLLDAGARDVWFTPAQFKKNRPGQVLHVICDPLDQERLTSIIIEETGTLGVRYQELKRFKLSREERMIHIELSGRAFDVRVKIARDGSGGTVRVKPEFEDVRRIAEALATPVRLVSERVTREAERILQQR